jgi:pantetheine-phosphate adenylyltransferase
MEQKTKKRLTSKKIGIYPGSFNPWHNGHEDIINKAMKVFDYVVVCVMQNPDKPEQDFEQRVNELTAYLKENTPQHIAEKLLLTVSFEPLVHTIQSGVFLHPSLHEYTAVIRGLRNGHDLQYEMNNQYWNEDLGLDIPFVYFITDRSLMHYSSTALRSIQNLGLLDDLQRNINNNHTDSTLNSSDE